MWFNGTGACRLAATSMNDSATTTLHEVRSGHGVTLIGLAGYPGDDHLRILSGDLGKLQ